MAANKTDPSVDPSPMPPWEQPPQPTNKPKAYTEGTTKVHDGNPGQLEGFSDAADLAKWAKYAGSGPDYGNVTHTGKK